jgi:uncharacterized membrane protein
MAETQRSKGGKKPPAAKVSARHGTLVLGRRNILLLLAGIIVILVGYVFLGKGSISAAPILLVLGYCVIVPLSIILWAKRPDDKTQSGTGE